jgi:hypothetical protein
MALLESDKRYAPILEKAQEKEWSNEECQIHFDRTAAKMNDQISPMHIPLPTPHSANAIVPDSDSDSANPNQAPDSDSDSEGEQGGDTEGTDNQQQQPSSLAQEIAAAQKWIEEERARRDVNRKLYEQREHTQRPCLRYSEGRNCYYDPCPFSHITTTPATPTAAPTPAAAELKQNILTHCEHGPSLRILGRR